MRAGHHEPLLDVDDGPVPIAFFAIHAHAHATGRKAKEVSASVRRKTTSSPPFSNRR
jgi:hypothetical protein